MSELLDKALERVTSMALLFKEEIEDDNFQPSIQWFVGDENRAIMFPDIQDNNRGELGWAASVLSATLPEFTSIVMANDSYMAVQATKMDGSDWGPGGMAYAVQNKTQDAVLVRECLTYIVIEADAVCMISLPYERTSQGKVLYDWEHKMVISTDDDEGGDLLGGEIAYQLRKAFEAPKLATKLKEFDVDPTKLGVDEDVVEVAMLCAGVKMIMDGTDGRFKVMIPARNETEKEYVRNSFSEDYDLYDASDGTQL